MQPLPGLIVLAFTFAFGHDLNLKFILLMQLLFCLMVLVVMFALGDDLNRKFILFM